MNKTAFLAAAFLSFACTFAHAGEYYKWMDANGNVHYSDSLTNVPEEYLDQVERRNVDEERPSSSVPSGKVSPPEQPAADGKETGKQPKRYEVPYTPYGGSAKRVIISAAFNGSVTAPLAIDTGAPDTMISIPLAKRLGLFDEDKGKLVVAAGGIGGTAPAVRSIIDTIQVGGAKINFVPITIISKISDSFDGLLGLDFVSDYSVTIDSRRKMVIFEEIPGDQEHPGGHDQEWWTAVFKEFASSRAEWKAYSESLDQELRSSLISVGNMTMSKKAFADNQYREAEKLFDKLNRYATQNAVPMHWRSY